MSIHRIKPETTLALHPSRFSSTLPRQRRRAPRWTVFAPNNAQPEFSQNAEARYSVSSTSSTYPRPNPCSRARNRSNTTTTMSRRRQLDKFHLHKRLRSPLLSLYTNPVLPNQPCQATNVYCLTINRERRRRGEFDESEGYEMPDSLQTSPWIFPTRLPATFHQCF